MLGTINLGAFVIAGLLLNITPGADLLYIGSRSASQGTRAGLIAALGIGCGGMVHVLFATVGLSAILMTSALAFTLVKLVGAGYLVWLGVSTLLALRNSDKQPSQTLQLPQVSGTQVFRQAILVNVLNPKVALFFLAFLPQFVAVDSASPALSFLFLGCIFNFNGTLVNLCFALLSSKMAALLGRHSRLGRSLKATVGALFVGLGIRLAVSSQQ